MSGQTPQSPQTPNVFSIPCGAPFLETLAKALISGELVQGFKPDNDPLALASVTIYVPTRRAARALRSVFAKLSGSGTAILPTIKPLGEFDEDASFFDETGAEVLDENQPIGAEERVLHLAKLVRYWAGFLPAHVKALFGTDPMVVPTTAADAVWLARDLASLIDEVEREGGSWEKLNDLVPEELAGWWQLTSEFMTIVSQHWPNQLQELGLSEPAAHRNTIMRAEATRLANLKHGGPVIAAGSTGSVPATAELLNVIARLPQGALVLPGLDRDLNDEAWDALSTQQKTPSVFGHPQFGLKKLMNRIGVSRDDVKDIGVVAESLKQRTAVISAALMPAHTTHHWATLQGSEASHEGFATVCEIVAASESQEAIAIAIALREAIEDGAVPAALVTTDRTLGRRVSAELERFGIKADDSGGTPLDQTPPAALFQLLLDVVFTPADPAKLLALLKHPLTALGGNRVKTRRGAEVLELLGLRGGVTVIELPIILERLVKLWEAKKGSHQRDWNERLSNDEIEGAVDVALALNDALAPLIAFASGSDPVSVSAACKVSVAAFEAIGMDETKGMTALYAGDSGEALATHLRNLIGAEVDYTFLPSEWPSIHGAMISGQAVKPKSGSDPRVFIWGALEARLQHVETIVLGGLNEKTWPSRPSDDPFLSRGMKGGIGIEPPERRVGLAAHDFQMLTGAKHVILSRAARIDGAPSVASRWLQRLHAVLGETRTKAMQVRAKDYLHWARQIDLGQNSPREKRPNPTPSLHLRPKRFSVTEIETLRRDPYAIHAKRILGLESLQPLLRQPDAAERGRLFHNIVEEFVRQRMKAPGTKQELEAIGKKLFAEEHLPDETHALWWRRFERMVENFIAFEEERSGSINASHVEQSSSEIEIGDSGVTLRGRADRIDKMVPGGADIMDYKTGTNPSIKQAFTLVSPQLALEAALLKRNGFDLKTYASDLIYVRLKPDGTVKSESILKSRENAEGIDAETLGERAWVKLNATIAYYASQSNGYISRAMPFKAGDLEGDYDHLARVMEWSSGGEDGGDASS